MINAEEHITPTFYLDKAVARLALEDARKLVAEGRTPEVAATLACPGAWSEWRAYVLAQLQDEA